MSIVHPWRIYWATLDGRNGSEVVRSTTPALALMDWLAVAPRAIRETLTTTRVVKD